MKKIVILLTLFVAAQTAMAQQFSLPILPQKLWPSDYAKYEGDVLNCCDWLLYADPTFNQPKHAECTAFLTRWLSGTPQVQVIIAEGLVDSKNPVLLTAYLAGWTRYSIQHKDDGPTLCAVNAVEQMLEFYTTHQKVVGTSKLTDDLLAQQSDGTLPAYIDRKLNK